MVIIIVSSFRCTPIGFNILMDSFYEFCALLHPPIVNYTPISRENEVFSLVDLKQVIFHIMVIKLCINATADLAPHRF